MRTCTAAAAELVAAAFLGVGRLLGARWKEEAMGATLALRYFSCLRARSSLRRGGFAKVLLLPPRRHPCALFAPGCAASLAC